MDSLHLMKVDSNDNTQLRGQEDKTVSYHGRQRNRFPMRIAAAVQDSKDNPCTSTSLTLYYSTVGLLKPTLDTNSNYLNLVHYKNLKFADFSCLFFLITMKLFLLIQHKGFKRKMRVFDKFLKILPIFSFRCKILILRIIFLVEIKRIRVNWCSRLDGLH